MADDPISSVGSTSSSPARSARPRVVESLDEAECLRLLGTGRLGRLVYSSRYGPMALPVEYAVHEGSIVFRTAQDTFTDEDLRTGIAHAEYNVAFEIDQIDLETGQGWTVLARGSAHHVDTEAERASGTLISGSAANQATEEAALAAYPGVIVDRVAELSNGEYNVHCIGDSWPHHIFVTQDFKAVGAE